MREARTGEKLVTSDGEERDLEINDLIITVADKPVALAGVMGGQATEISENLSCCPWRLLFQWQIDSRLSRRLNLRSEVVFSLKKGINVQPLTKPLMRRLA